MSFLKKLFNLGGANTPTAAPEKTLEHEGFLIRATPYQEGGRYQLCGVISKEVDGVMKKHEFIRADTFATVDDAVEMVFFKARQMIDQQGVRLLD